MVQSDLIIYALVAVGLIFWLRSILGTRSGSESQRPNPFTGQPGSRNSSGQNSSSGTPLPSRSLYAQADQASDPLALPKTGNISIANPACESVLLNIARMDRGFTLARFATGAQDAFVMIVEAFASGDLPLLQSLLAPQLYAAFEQSINARKAAGETMSTEILAIRKTEITDAQIKDRIAFITVRLVADETVVVRDRAGALISGHPDRVRDTHDIWTFGRDMKAKDPTWHLYATREEDPDPLGVPVTA